MRRILVATLLLFGVACASRSGNTVNSRPVAGRPRRDRVPHGERARAGEGEPRRGLVAARDGLHTPSFDDYFPAMSDHYRSLLAT